MPRRQHEASLGSLACLVSWICVEMFRTHHLIIDSLPNDPLERSQRYSRLLFCPAGLCVIISTMLQLNSQKERCQKERCQKEYLQKEAPARGHVPPGAHVQKYVRTSGSYTCPKVLMRRGLRHACPKVVLESHLRDKGSDPPPTRRLDDDQV